MGRSASHCWIYARNFKFLSSFLGFKKLVIKSLFNVSIHFLWTITVCALFRRKSIDPKLCFSVLAYPPVELLFFSLLTNSSMFILPPSSGICFMLKFFMALLFFVNCRIWILAPALCLCAREFPATLQEITEFAIELITCVFPEADHSLAWIPGVFGIGIFPAFSSVWFIVPYANPPSQAIYCCNLFKRLKLFRIGWKI